MGKSLDDFINTYESTRFLKQNLEVNMDTYCEDMPREERDQFMRMNLIMIRQCLMDFGAE